MLRDLTIQNLAVLEQARVEFGPGLNVLTGETGAGKSIVVDSLALLAGARADSELIRTGADLLRVTGIFEPAGSGWTALLEKAGLAVDDEELVVRREVNRAGRNRIFVNDQPVTLRLLASVAPYLMRIHSQREELGLVSPELRLSWLDRAGGKDAVEPGSRTAAAYRRWKGLADRLERLGGDERTRLERIDLLQFQVGEIDAARLEPGEDEELRVERDQLRNREAIVGALGHGYRVLFEDDGSASERLSGARSRLEAISEWQPGAEGWAEELADVSIRVEELAHSLRDELARVEADSTRLDAVEERLALVERLCRKYGVATADVLTHREQIGAELELLETDAEAGEELAGETAAALEEYRDAALELSAARQEWGGRLADRIHHELADLAMGKARFAVSLERRRRRESPLRIDGDGVEFGSSGIDHADFRVAANPGQEMGPVSRVASGGELSRIYLALQLAARDEAQIAEPTLVFDEVDAGIGGAEAAALGAKLQRLSRGGQILAVTHLPQVASFGDRHFRVEKRSTREATTVLVRCLKPDERVEEVARMLAGAQVTPLSISHAQELLAGSAAEDAR